MDYRIGQLAQLAGVSERTLRWYERQGLLRPSRLRNGYRVYTSAELDRLQHILFYRELGLSLEQIRAIVQAPDYDARATLRLHLTALKDRRAHLDSIIDAVEKTVHALEGDLPMSDEQKFEAFKRKALRENEKRYGAEIREKYGVEAAEASNARFAELTQEQHAQMEALTQRLNAALKEACEQGDPTSTLAVEACEMHREWLCYFWPHYSAQQHRGVTQMYVDDPRFTAYYDEIAPGCALFLRDAVWAWTED
jgi:DNA-binding transcriptional MerR regulator